MINKELINPKNIVVIGGSNNILKPGGKIVKNLIDGSFKGELLVVNPREKEVQGISCYATTEDLPVVDLAIIVISASQCYQVIDELASNKATKAFIILSAGFGEAGALGVLEEQKIVEKINSVNGCLIGPNCIGVLNKNYKGIFTTPIPNFDKDGCDLISSSGATAVFIMEAGIGLGLKFANIYSVGNAAQTSVEDVLEYMDENFDPQSDSSIKLLYLESIKNPKKLLKHAKSLINKGCKIAAIKAGSTDEGSRAAASHTGAIASSDRIVRALFKKAGIVYCSSRRELITVASIFNYKELKGKNIVIITHAGGSAVMLTDVLIKGGLNVPSIEGENADKLLGFLHNGSSVSNPIDFLATGTAEQLGIIIDYCEHKFDHIDAMIVVFGSPGLFNVQDVYNVLSVKLDVCKKPIYPVLPSLINAQKEIDSFLIKGNINFPDEVVIGRALPEVYNTLKPSSEKVILPKVDVQRIRKVIDAANDGFLSPREVNELLDAAEISRVKEIVVATKSELQEKLSSFSFPVVMKVVGPIHKTDVGGVILNVQSMEESLSQFDRLMQLEDANSVMVQSMHSGVELFIGVLKEKGFDHAILCGLGGVFIEVLDDFSINLSPVSKKEAKEMVLKLKGYKLIEGIRGNEGVDEQLFIDTIGKVSALVEVAPEIQEMDMNPLFGRKDSVTAVDTRIRVLK
ncbi:MAG: acetate--CoA ligase family protein [Fluviicola sp.]|nr:acetate--CoA ligase family protein [Fluviicola sp.]